MAASCGPRETDPLAELEIPEPTAADLLLIGDGAGARALLEELPEGSPERDYAAAQLALADGEPRQAAALLAALDDPRAEYQLVRLQLAGLVRAHPDEQPPPGDDPALELGRGLALLNAGFREDGLARLEPLDNGPLGCLAQLARSRELDPVEEGPERRRALETAWSLTTPVLRRLVFPDYRRLLDERGGGRGVARELDEERGLVTAASPLWDELTYWTALLSGEDRRRELAWELLAENEPTDDTARRRTLELLEYSTDVPAGERARQIALALELGDLDAAADELGRLPDGPAAVLLRGELESARGRYGLSLAQYETLYGGELDGPARLYAGVAQFNRGNDAAADELWIAVAATDVPTELEGTYLERDAERAAAKAAYYRGNLLRYSSPARAAALYASALRGGLEGQERARAAWRRAMILAEAGDFAGASRAMVQADHDPAYVAHCAYWVPRLAGLATGEPPPEEANWSHPFYELPARRDRWWLYDYSGGDPAPWGGLFEGCYSTLGDPELDLLLDLAGVGDDTFFEGYLAALEYHRGDDPLMRAAAALARVRRRCEVGDYAPAPGLEQAGRALALTDAARPEGLLALPFAYPLVYAEESRAAVGRVPVDPLLLTALAREESRFDPGVVSRAGALGLTQQMPGTAALTAAELGLEDYDPREPADSLLLGAAYLSRMLERYDGDLLLALAAYNAGPGNADRWVAARETLPPDLWLLTTPFDETRRYVVRVLGSYRRYRQLYGN